MEDKVFELEREVEELKWQVAELKRDLGDLLKLDVGDRLKEIEHWVKYLVKKNPPES